MILTETLGLALLCLVLGIALMLAATLYVVLK